MRKHQQKSKFTMTTLVDEKAGNWPSESFVKLHDIADLCLAYRLSERQEMTKVSNLAGSTALIIHTGV